MEEPRAGLSVSARQTGGAFADGSNDLRPAVARMWTDMQHSYLLSFDSDRDVAGSSARVRVRVKVRGATVLVPRECVPTAFTPKRHVADSRRMAYVPLHVRTARSMTRGLVACAIVAAWALGNVVGSAGGDLDGRAGDYEEILLAAVFSGAAMCGALSVVLQGRTPSTTTSQLLVTTALGLPYLLGLYLGLYRGLWGATDLFDAASPGLVVRTAALCALGYALVTVAGDLTRCVQQRAGATVRSSGRSRTHRPVHP
jgi:hypothetical protein